MEINNRTVRLLYQTNNYFDENLWSFLEENFDLQLDSNEFLIKNKFIFLDKNILNAFKNNEFHVIHLSSCFSFLYRITFSLVLKFLSMCFT